MTSYYKHGNWNAICDTCGFVFKSGELRKNWKGLMVCSRDYESRHPQDFIRARHEDTSVPWTRPEPDDININVCYVWTTSCYADLATSDCALADNQTYTYAQLLALRDGT